MDTVIINPSNISFSDFIESHKQKIGEITPKNPSISKSDIWRHEDFWDKDYKEKPNG